MKSFLITVAIILSLFSAKAQFSNTFIQRNKLVINPVFRYYNLPDENKTYGAGFELAYMVLDKFELKPGVIYYFGTDKDLELVFTTRYYLLKSKFTVFPQVSYSYLSNNSNNQFAVGFGIGYYGILKRIGIDLIVDYDPIFNHIFPDAKLKILLGKIE